MSTLGFLVFFGGGVAGLVLLYWACRILRGQVFVRRWARAEGWNLIRSKWCWDGGPFSLLGGALPAAPFDVYQVTVARKGDGARVGHVKCGTWLALGFTPMVLFEVRLDGEAGPRK